MSKILNSIYVFVLFFVVDAMFSWFTPKWRKRAHVVYKESKRYLNYRHDLLSDEQIASLSSQISELKEALKTFNKEKCQTLPGKLEHLVSSIPGPSSRSGLAENVEVLFVILVIFLGIRAYIAQPFRIPTGSMQPSLNGIIVHQYGEEPSLFGKGTDMLLKGSSYVHETAASHMRVVGYEQGTKFMLLTRTTVLFDNGMKIDIPSAKNEVMKYFFDTKRSYTPSFAAGETIMKARIDAGDLIIVNKMAYHFRKPQLGETFVFDTRGIDGIKSRSSSDQAGGTHYVKRLCGLPGDSLTIETPHLLINGKLPDVWTIKRVMDAKPPYNPVGYNPAPPETDAKGNPIPLPRYLAENQTMRLRKNDKIPALNQYCALGDNTVSSLDSRYWGPVNQYNIIGPASFALWPFTSHWGIIP